MMRFCICYKVSGNGRFKRSIDLPFVEAHTVLNEEKCFIWQESWARARGQVWLGEEHSDNDSFPEILSCLEYLMLLTKESFRSHYNFSFLLSVLLE